ncbi:PKD domain-containing protein [Blastococcus sp. SYSU D00820]
MYDHSTAGPTTGLRATTAWMAVLLLVAGMLAGAFGGGSVARADSAPTNPANPATPATVTADALPTVQINGVAWSQVVVGNTVYVAGSFTRARPAGVPAGQQETVRNNILAYDIRTGQLITSFAPSLNGQALAIAASPDGSRIYVGGDFTQVNGQTRNRIAALTPDGTLVSGWAPSVSGRVRAIAATNTTVYFGGALSAVGGVSRTRLAAVSATNGALQSWAPVPGVGSTAGNEDGNRGTSNEVLAMVITSNPSQVVVGGRFDSMNGVRATGVAAIDPSSGANRTFAINQQLTNQGVNSAVWSLSTDGSTVYGTAYDYYGPGNLEGAFAAAASGGAVRWVNVCFGDTYSSFPMAGVLYEASHAHRCNEVGSWPEQTNRVWKRANALSLAPSGIVDGEWGGNWMGQPAPATLPWYPTVAAGSYTGQAQGGWHVTGNGQYLVYGGEFPTVNGTGQQGLVRFGFASTAPNRVGPDFAGATPSVAVLGAGTVRVAWTAAFDNDNENLTYRVYRDNNTTTPVATFTRSSQWWNRPVVGWTDTGVTAGSHTYRVTASDPAGNTAATGWVTANVGTGGGTARQYSNAVLSAGATGYWPLGETSGAAYDRAGGMDMTVNSGVSRNTAGAIANDGDRAFTFNGTSSGYLAPTVRTQAPNTFSVEFWFSTTSRNGGRFIGFGDNNTGTSFNQDRLVYMDTAGKVNFGVWPRAGRTVTSPQAYNDGRWHHVVASLGSNGMRLYVDGVLVGSRTDTTFGQNNYGFWRIGGDTTWNGSGWVNGRMDEVAVYPTALASDVVASHHRLGTTGAPTNTAPTASFTATPSGSVVAVNGSASSDATGSIRSYAWNWGDGTANGSGVSASHTYTRAGTYTITLTVTDDGGLTGTTTRQVTVGANQAPTASFTTSVTGSTAGVDGSASADADGTIASYSWNWGDNTPAGSGATASHTYGTAGTYTITLTVTDNAGATGSTTRSVTVGAPTGTPAVATDTFGRTVTGGWGTADIGGPWTAAVGATRLSVGNGYGELNLPGAGNNTGAYLGGVSQTSTNVTASFSLTAMPTGTAGTYVYVSGRRTASGDEYRARVRITSTGQVALVLSRITSGTEAFPGGEIIVPGLTYTAGATLNVRVQTSGTGTTTVAARVWLSGQAEPAAAQLTRTDTTASLQTAGAVGLAAYRSSSNTVATAVRFTAYSVTAG